MLDFEKLGAFYLGKRYDMEAEKLTDELVLYDSKDLNTHAVIIGMTGSGKTGLGVGILEEAALDHIPVIAIDPKGDMGNLLLTFPKLRAQDFRPWINERTAADKGQSPDEFAAAQAALWKKGIGQWGQTGKRIAQLQEERRSRRSIRRAVTQGIPVSILHSFDAPAAGTHRRSSTCTASASRRRRPSILTLLDIERRPCMRRREHILISRLLDHAWKEGRSLDLPGLIAEIQDPPISEGRRHEHRFLLSRRRTASVSRCALNNLLAAPGFEAWMQGAAAQGEGPPVHRGRQAARLGHGRSPHLDDAQRMFFVSMLLNEIIALDARAARHFERCGQSSTWTRSSATCRRSRTRPRSELFLTLLKQARAYGVGLVLATQNPVDLDYKGLSNTGTWFIGRSANRARQGPCHGGSRGRQRRQLRQAGDGAHDRGARQAAFPAAQRA